MRQHHAADTKRFILTERPENGYGRFLVSMLGDPDCLVLVAEHSGDVVGYVFAEVEAISWKELRGPSGFYSDLFVHDRMRGQGAGRALLTEAIAWIRSKGITQIVLWSEWEQRDGSAAVREQWIPRTMMEMTLDDES